LGKGVLPTNTFHRQDDPAVEPSEPIFYCRNIARNYEGKPVISGIDLDLHEGGIISLVGPSGVGKTTLFNVLSGVDHPDEGRIFLDGKDITGIAGKLSYMMQKDLLLEYRTVLDNVILPLVIRKMRKQTAREYAASFFERFGLKGFEKKYPRQLSGGMRQRAALLRSCLQSVRIAEPEEKKPGDAAEHPVILLDEPFSALDALTRRTMQDWFLEIITGTPLGAYPLSAVFITHDVEEAIILSDRVYVLTGRPGNTSAVFDIPAPRPRNRDFFLQAEFALLKKAVLDAVEN